MNNGLAIATVTATLRTLLSNRLVADAEANGIGEVSVSALPPDRIAAGTDERNQLNVFMHRLAPHTRVHLEGTVKSAASPNEQPGLHLTFDLYYLITAYGIQDLHTDILLGLVIQLFHDTPVLSRSMVREAVGMGPHGKGNLVPVERAIAASDFEFIDRIELTPQFTSAEEMSKLWSALQTRFRPSVSYKASPVVLGPKGVTA